MRGRCAVCILIVFSAGAAAQPARPLTQAAAIKALPPEAVRAGKPVRLRGVVTQVVPEWWGYSVEDSTDGIYVAAGRAPTGLEVGQAVEITGQTAGGNFAPVVRAAHTRILGPAPMPKAARVDWPELATGSCDNEYVEVEGIVRSAGVVEPPAWEWRAEALRIDLGGNFIWAYLRDTQALVQQRLVDSTVRVRGVCIVFTNGQRQFQGTALGVGRSADVEVLQAGPEDPFDAPRQSLPRLFGFHPGSVSFHRVKVVGTAILQAPGGIYLQDGTSGILVRTTAAPAVQPGDRVEAVGFPASGGYSKVLEDALVRVIGQESGPAPREMAADQVLARASNAPAAPAAVLLRVNGRVLDRGKSTQDETLILAAGRTTFSARLRSGAGKLSNIAPGSQVAVTGVSVVQADDRGLPEAFELLLRSPADVRVLKGPPWLSRGVALQAAGALLAFLAAATIWLISLRRRVEKQTATIRRQFEREAALEQRYSELAENASDLVYIRDLEGRILQVNRGAEELTGYTRAELLGMSVLDLMAPEERNRVRAEWTLRPGADGMQAAPEWRCVTKDGRELVIETKQRFLAENGKPVRVECIGRDVTARHRAQLQAVTERDRLEEQLQHAQKLESVGLLAGGVAHDFNNMLTVITGYAAMALDQISADDPLRESITEIAEAAERAGGLTRQLLLFSRRQTVAPKVLALNELAGGMEKMLRRLIGEDIQLTFALDAREGMVRADPGHLEQVIMNLVVNARDAMPVGGTIAIRTEDFHAGADFAKRRLGLAEGNYVRLLVTDSGTGMTPEVRSRIFEPFFTTKEQGKGTGLGLSMVYGIVRQSGGSISVDSAPGRGSTFEILLPAVRGGESGEAGGTAAGTARRGGETILVTEDEPGVRKYIRDVLKRRGYQVLEAANGLEALEVAAQYQGPIHLLLTDVVMPELGGAELAERFAKLRAGTPILHMSGYTDRLQSFSPESLLQKPFTPAVLLARVESLLNGG